MVVGGACGMMAVSASALELGELKINSSLGQPLRASIAFALNPHEGLYDYCVYLRPGLAANGLPSFSKATISIADGMILLAGDRGIREPLLALQVSVDCPGTAHLTRQYALMLNPAQTVTEASVVVESSAASRSVAVTSTALAEASKPQPRVGRSRIKNRSPISESSRYLVQRGDSLSDIASRISARSIALWPAVDRIFAANPGAFINGDRNWLKAGSWLEIPDLSVAAPESFVAEAVTTAASEPASQAGNAQAYAGYGATAALETADTEEASTVPDEGPAATVADAPEIGATSIPDPDAGRSEFANLRPGDILFGDDSPFVSPIGSPADADITEFMMFPDTEIVATGKTSQDSETDGGTSGSWSWLMWLGGTGLALILGLLLFGQRFRQRFGSVAIAVPLEPRRNRRKTDPVQAAKAIAVTDVDFEVPDSSSHASTITLDADLDDGRGLQYGPDIDVVQDFDFSASTDFADDLDMLLPESADEEIDSSATDVLPPPERKEKNSILDDEIPASYDSQYDLSIIVDATKQNLGEMDGTTKDLQAVLVEIDNITESEDSTLCPEADYKDLEQDYENELTATTQALDVEIARAATELAARVDNDATGKTMVELPKNTAARNDDSSDLDSTSIEKGPTVEMPIADIGVTVVTPADADVLTVDMLIESGRIDTKKKKKAS